MSKENWKREKKWKNIPTRSEKQNRSKQLGSVYPTESDSEMLARESTNILFICSMNQWRSPTAEKIFSDKPLINVRSRGTSHKAVRSITSADLGWADLVFVMEEKHKQRLMSQYPGEMRYKKIFVLDIPDDYKFMDPDLIVEIENAVDPLLP